MLNWNEDTKKATVTITVTDENYFNKALQLKTGIASSVTIYVLSKLPTIDNAVLNNNTVTWSGEDLDKFNSLTLYVINIFCFVQRINFVIAVLCIN